jgi:hypothetical protein
LIVRAAAFAATLLSLVPRLRRILNPPRKLGCFPNAAATLASKFSSTSYTPSQRRRM